MQTQAKAAGEGRRGVRGGGEATRLAILEAARQQFGARAYEQVGLRDIAAAAGATAALVNRYFGTKEQLFREVLESGKPLFFERLLVDRAHFGESVARMIVYGDSGAPHDNTVAAHTAASTPETPAPDNVSYVVHSLGNPVVAGMIRELLDNEAVPKLAAWLGGGPDARLRAEMVFSCFAGVHAMRQVVGTRALKAANAESLLAALAPVLQACVGEASVGDASVRDTTTEEEHGV
jgi:AcrR family transcriptional regulator